MEVLVFSHEEGGNYVVYRTKDTRGDDYIT